MKCYKEFYGTCWASKKELNDYLHRLEEAEKRDHRKLGKEMDLFHFREDIQVRCFGMRKADAISKTCRIYENETTFSWIQRNKYS